MEIDFCQSFDIVKLFEVVVLETKLTKFTPKSGFKERKVPHETRFTKVNETFTAALYQLK